MIPYTETFMGVVIVFDHGVLAGLPSALDEARYAIQMEMIAENADFAFGRWTADLDALAAQEGCPNYTQQTGYDCWREAFLEGVSPLNAWLEEKAAAADNL